MPIFSPRFQAHVPIIGRSTTEKVFDRLPVQELQANHPYQWTLFILAWAFLKDTPIPVAGVVQPALQLSTSFMEIAAIHGRPYREWPGDMRTPEEAQVDFNPNDKKDTYPTPPRFGGYCHHAAITFPSWHRPYLMLLEQTIGQYAENIAQQIEHSHPEEVGLWVGEAKQLRFPYWDWADPKLETEGFPSLFYTDKLTVMGLGKKAMDVSNPLVYFEFPYIPDDFQDETSNTGQTSYLSKWKQTWRYPGETPNPTASDIQQLQSTLKENAQSLRSGVGQLFTFPDGGDPAAIYDEFSNTRVQSSHDGSPYHIGNVEAVHNNMHANLGGNGHMGIVDYAAFDPLFYFHHCNIDRIAALWDWCYPDYWMGDGFVVDTHEQKWTLSNGTYSAAYSQQIEEDGEWGVLVPWRHPDGSYWNSKETRFFTTEAFPKYYSYKEFLNIKVDNAAASLTERQEARARIAKYYNVDPLKSVENIHKPSWQHVTVPNVGDVELPPDYEPVQNFRVYKVIAKLHEHALGASYHFHLKYKKELVGSATVFTRGDNSPCKACTNRRAQNSVVTQVILIPDRIINEILVHNSNPSGKLTEDEHLSLICHAFTGELTHLAGKILATAQGGHTVATVLAQHAAPKTIHPAEITLLSSAVAQHKTDKEKMPAHFFDFKNHGDMFPSGWKMP